MGQIAEWLTDLGWTLPGWLLPLVGVVFSATAIRAAWEAASFYRTLRKEAQERTAAAERARQDASEEVFWKLEERYLELLALNFHHPRLGVGLDEEDAAQLGPEDRRRRKIYYEMLFALFERAYLNRDRTIEIEKYQWPGWESYIEAYLRKPSCRAEWLDPETGHIIDSYGLDRRFEEECVKPTLRKIVREQPPPPVMVTESAA